MLCHNVPIARTGTYQYLRSEIGLEGNGVVTVYREPKEVFDNVAIASFEGKAFTDNHPLEDVTVDNWSMYAKGEISDVRRGSGDKKDFLVADILVRDPIVINEIQSGAKREISAGYDCEYIEKDGKIFQTHLRGNHVALVQAGRAGSRVRINDNLSVPELKIPARYWVVKRINKAIKLLS